MIRSPLNYTGGKYKLLPQIAPYFPKNINKFLDLFCGGCNVGINTSANQYVFNDNCKQLIYLYKAMQQMPYSQFIDGVQTIIKKYSLSETRTYGYSFYGCNSSQGLGKYNKEQFYKLRADFNALDTINEIYCLMLYVLIVFSFNNQIRFNSKGEFNLPVGKRDFNEKMRSKLENFIVKIQDNASLFSSLDFREIDVSSLNANDFVYVDPPYLITCATYNELGGWKETDELDLLRFLDNLTENDIKFALSNVLESNGNSNLILKDWLERNPQYRVVNLKYSYKNSNYHKRNRNLATKEVLILNY